MNLSVFVAPVPCNNKLVTEFDCAKIENKTKQTKIATKANELQTNLKPTIEKNRDRNSISFGFKCLEWMTTSLCMMWCSLKAAVCGHTVAITCCALEVHTHTRAHTHAHTHKQARITIIIFHVQSKHLALPSAAHASRAHSCTTHNPHTHHPNMHTLLLLLSTTSRSRRWL